MVRVYNIENALIDDTGITVNGVCYVFGDYNEIFFQELMCDIRLALERLKITR